MNFTSGEFTVKNGGRRIYGMLWRPDIEKKCPAIILSHGFNGTHADWTRECAFYASNGFAAYAFDFCGGSSKTKSTGLKSTEMTISSEKSDLLAVFNAISSLNFIDSERIVLFGGSQGGLVSALAAAELGGRVRALGLYFPALCIPDDWRKRFPDPAKVPDEISLWGLTLGRGFVEDVRSLDVFRTIESFSSPVLIIHGDRDSVVMCDYSVRAVSVFPDARLIVLPGEAHGFTPQGAETAMEHILSFMLE